MKHCMRSSKLGGGRAGRHFRWLTALVLLLSASASAASVIGVTDARELRDALRSAETGTTIEILPGDYLLPGIRLEANARESGPFSGPITVRAAVPGTVRLWSTAETLFELRGGEWHFSGLDFQGNSRAAHAIHLTGATSGTRIEGNRFQNFHSAIRSGGRGQPVQFPDNVRILRNVFVNDTPRSTRLSITGIDAVGGRGWVIAENFFADLALTPRGSGRPSAAAVVRGGAYGAVLDRNVVICEWQHHGGQRMGLSLGGEGTRSGQRDDREMAGCGDACPETQFSRVTNNVILNCPDEPGIYASKASRSLVANNTVFNAFGIQARFPETWMEATDNLVSGTIWERDDAHAEAFNNLVTGRLDRANRLPGVKRKITPPTPEHRIMKYEWLDRLIRGVSNTLKAWLDGISNSFVGKGLTSFHAWFLYPEAGDFRLLDGDRIQATGSSPPKVSHDFCGQPRLGPSDVGAIEYKAGNCLLLAELGRRHGGFLADLMENAEEPPPDWSAPDMQPVLSASLPQPKRILDANPSNYRGMVSRLEPGDWLRLAPGEYPRQLTLHGRKGTAEHPIVISGPETGEAAVFMGRRGSNTVSLLDSAHIVIRHLTLDGQGFNIAGVAAEGHGNYAHDITVEHLTIRNYSGSQGNSGITVRVPSWNWVIRHNDIRDVGTGVYVGSPDGQGPFIGGIIENNFIADTLGYNVQIKHQKIRDRLPHMPTEPRQTVIRYNVFSKTTGGSSGDRARPNVLVGHLPPRGPGQHDRYLIYGNLFHENPHERLFQGEGNLEIYNNLFVNRSGDGLIVRRHNDVPKEVRILNNTVVAEGFGIAVVHPDRDYPQGVAGNAVFAGEPLQLPRRIDGGQNLVGTRAAAQSMLVNPDAALPQLDLFPRGQEVRHREALPAVSGLPDYDRDYTGRLRHGAVWGAYASEHPVNIGRKIGIGPAVSDCAPCR